MALRVVHTSDWHLGLSTYKTSREPDHRLFVAWLIQVLADYSVDVLVIAGDLFDQAQPSAESLSLYYHFLHLVGGTCVRKVVVVGGNHDSAARLNAASDVLEALDVHVVGGLTADPQSWERCICPIRSPDGTVSAVVLAVPYIHEFRLGVRTTSTDVHETQTSLRQAFRGLYTELTNRATERFPGVPVIATGHLTCGSSDREDYPVEIHQAGFLGGLPSTIFDQRLQYVALGHIHRATEVEPGRVWYCGSPLAYSLREIEEERKVLLVDLPPDPTAAPTITPVVVPTFRALIRLEGPPTDVAARLRRLTWKGELEPLIYAFLHVDRYDPEAEALLYQARDVHPASRRPRVVHVRQIARLAESSPDIPGDADQPLAALQPDEVFIKLCNWMGEPPDRRLLQAFSMITTIGELPYEDVLDQDLSTAPQTELLNLLVSKPAKTEWQYADARGLFQASIADHTPVEVQYRTRTGTVVTVEVQPTRLAQRGSDPVVIATDTRSGVPMTLVLKRVKCARRLSTGEAP